MVVVIEFQILSAPNTMKGKIRIESLGRTVKKDPTQLDFTWQVLAKFTIQKPLLILS